MAKRRVTQFYSLQQSLFRADTARKHTKLPDLAGEDETQTKRGKINTAFCNFVMVKCATARVSSGVPIGKAVSVICRRPMPDSAAWQWLLDEFLRENCQFASPAYEELVQRARWRVKKVRRQEKHVIDRERIERESAEVRGQHAAERKANGGEASFFDSNKWQRLRYEVLVASNGCCALCGRSTREHGVILHVDHIKPRSRFPNLSLVKSNLQVLCENCNLGKSNRDTIDWSVGAADDSLSPTG